MTLHTLIGRGDYVAVERGHLIIKAASGKPVPPAWLDKHSADILQQIAKATGRSIFKYLNYSTGRYGRHLSSGVLLNYVDAYTGQTSPVFYNAELTRDRTTKAGKKGTALPKGQFRIKPNGSFKYYWLMLGLPLPRRLSEFHYAMGKLGSVDIAANVDEKGQIDKASIKPDITHEEIYLAVMGKPFAAGNSLARSWQATGNLLARTTGKEIATTQAQQGFQANMSASTKQYEQSNQEGASKAMPLDSLSIGNTPINQSVDDWLNDYSSTLGRFSH